MKNAPGPGRALVTGGAGFIGSHLCARLHGDGWTVVCLDDFSTGRHGNIARLAGQPRFSVVDHDVTRPYELGAFDAIWNLACPASPVAYQRDPVKTLKTSVLGAIHAANAALACGARLVQSSTSEVYGDPQVHPQTEDYRGHVNPIGPRACYDEGKRCAETLLMDHARRDDLDLRIARIFNTYGPRMQPDDGRVVSNFIVRALAGEALVLYGDGGQTRSFCFVDDTVDGLVRLAHCARPDGPINLGNPHEMTVCQLAERVLALIGGASRVECGPLPADDPVRRQPDIGRARRWLGWEPQVGIDEGLAATVDWFACARAEAA